LIDCCFDQQQQQPLIYLPQARLSSLQALLDFMYSGEVSLSQQDLGPFLNLAEELRVKGTVSGDSE
jgi:hypothetical protein